MALDAGRIVSLGGRRPRRVCTDLLYHSQVEFDTPSRLLQREESIFRALVHASKDREALLAMVNHSG